MKKVFVMAYLRKNFGDDLFVKMLLEKYKNIDFYIKADKSEFIDVLERYDNLHVLYGKDTDEELYNSDVNEYDAYVYIGGSIFMEGGSSYNLSEKFYDFLKRCKENQLFPGKREKLVLIIKRGINPPAACSRCPAPYKCIWARMDSPSACGGCWPC